MKNASSRKELLQQYKERKIVGGVFAIRNNRKNKALLDASPDLRGSRNRFEFAQSTGSCVEYKLKSDWEEQGGEGFAFEVLEELEKSPEQTDSEFSAEIRILKELWLEKLAGEELY